MNGSPTGEVSRHVGQRLREERERRGLSLAAVQEHSDGRIKGAILAGYERADRGLGLERLYEVAEFYRIPPAELLPGGTPPLVAETFVAITKAKDAEIARLTRSYEDALEVAREEIARLRERIGAAA